MDLVRRKISRVETLTKVENQSLQVLKQQISELDNVLKMLKDRSNNVNGKIEIAEIQIKKIIVDSESVDLSKYLTYQKIVQKLQTDLVGLDKSIVLKQEERTGFERQLSAIRLKVKGYERVLERYHVDLSNREQARFQANQDKLVLTMRGGTQYE